VPELLQGSFRMVPRGSLGSSSMASSESQLGAATRWIEASGMPLNTTESLAKILYCNRAYSDLACSRIGISGSASFQSARKA
jgi:hypothetical protein